MRGALIVSWIVARVIFSSFLSLFTCVAWSASFLSDPLSPADPPLLPPPRLPPPLLPPPRLPPPRLPPPRLVVVVCEDWRRPFPLLPPPSSPSHPAGARIPPSAKPSAAKVKEDEDDGSCWWRLVIVMFMVAAIFSWFAFTAASFAVLPSKSSRMERIEAIKHAWFDLWLLLVVTGDDDGDDFNNTNVMCPGVLG